MCHSESIRFAQDKFHEGSRFLAQGKLREESDTKCHPERSEGSAELLRFAQYKLHGVYPEPKSETLPLRFTQGQGDTSRRVQNDKHGISLIVTQSLGGEGWGEGNQNSDLLFRLIH